MASGTVTAADIAAYLRQPVDEGVDQAWATQAAAGATAYVNSLTHVADSTETEWDADTRAGAVMLAGRLFQSRNAPLGAAGFDAMGGVVISRTDPELARLLRIGRFLPPAVG